MFLFLIIPSFRLIRLAAKVVYLGLLMNHLSFFFLFSLSNFFFTLHWYDGSIMTSRRGRRRERLGLTWALLSLENRATMPQFLFSM
ncbi:hypothetical protein QBC47DRAFT_387513 [Echria macrotheca]|uniref:Uncharacterized protein n=1 Tax=Echria macrotheca TaxID=438768 RepID=A0AAJ0B916_9PEZI|nr:hypothetical protein QBC47DRAFT_387513 [Echria macrotheca]